MRNEAKAARTVSFLELLTFTAGDFTGKPFRLQQWQREPIEEFYGTVEQDDRGEEYRHYQYLYLEVPKKNGKTEVAAGLGLYHLLADSEPNPQVFICAADKDNAAICYNAMLVMIDQSPWLGKHVKTVPSRREIRLKGKPGMIKVLSAEAYSKHGYNISCVIFDELHAQPNRELWDIMTFGSGSARRQPVWIVLTTAGDDPDRHSIGWEIHEQCRRILAARDGTGKPEDDNPIWLPVIYGLPDDPETLENIDIYDEDLWYQVNPSLGVSVPLRTMRQEAADAKRSEAKERLFRWLRLNQWVATKAVGWLPLTLYDRTQWHIPELDALADTVRGPEIRARMRATLRRKKCYGGLDLSSTTDLSAFVLVFPPQPGVQKWTVLFQAWRPEEGTTEAEKRDHVPYRDWSRAGYLNLCAGDMVDFEQIKDAIRQANKEYNLQILGVDPYLSREISGSLSSEGVNIVEVRQTMTELSPAMKEVERLLRSGEMVHEHNTCARWCFGNVRCAVDGNENVKPMKNKSIGRIDITVAWIIAQATAMLQPSNPLADLLATGKWSL